MTYTRDQVLAMLVALREAAAVECDKESAAQKRAERIENCVTFVDYAAKHIRQLDVSKFVDHA